MTSTPLWDHRAGDSAWLRTESGVPDVQPLSTRRYPARLRDLLETLGDQCSEREALNQWPSTWISTADPVAAATTAVSATWMALAYGYAARYVTMQGLADQQRAYFDSHNPDDDFQVERHGTANTQLLVLALVGAESHGSEFAGRVAGAVLTSRALLGLPTVVTSLLNLDEASARYGQPMSGLLDVTCAFRPLRGCTMQELR